MARRGYGRLARTARSRSRASSTGGYLWRGVQQGRKPGADVEQRWHGAAMGDWRRQQGATPELRAQGACHWRGVQQGRKPGADVEQLRRGAAMGDWRGEQGAAPELRAQGGSHWRGVQQGRKP